MKKLYMFFVLTFLAAPAFCQAGGEEYYTGYEGTVLGERTPTSAGEQPSSTEELAAKVTTNVPGDIYRGTVFGADKRDYASTTLGNRARAKTKFVYDTSLVRAVKVGDADRVRTLLFANVNVNEKNYAGITPLAIAAEKGNMDIIKMLVEEGNAKVNELSSYGVTPLIAAAAAGNEQVTQYLIAHGADVTAKDDLGKTALLHAVSKDNPKLIRSLINLNSKASDMPDATGNTPLIYAAQAGALSSVKTLVETGKVNVNYKNAMNGISALSAAAAEGQNAVVRYLLRSGANIDIRDAGGRTPLFYALETNQPKVFATLLSQGADVNAKDATGKTVLSVAVLQQKPEFVEILKAQKKTDLNSVDDLGRTALMYTATDPSGETAAVLVKSKLVDLNLRDSNGDTALMQAVKNKNQKTALVLLKTNTDTLAVNNDGKTVFDLSDEYMAGTPAAGVLNVKRMTIQQDVQTIVDQKAAEVAALEAQLAQDEALVNDLQAQAGEQLEAARSRLGEGLSENDEEIIRLQQQLDAAKAQREAALREAADEKISAVSASVPAPSVLTEETAAVTAAAAASAEDIAKEIQEAEAKAAAQQEKARKAAQAKAKRAKARAAAKAKAAKEAAEKAAAEQAAAAQAVYNQATDAVSNAYNAAGDAYNAAGDMYDPYAAQPVYDGGQQPQM